MGILHKIEAEFLWKMTGESRKILPNPCNSMEYRI